MNSKVCPKCDTPMTEKRADCWFCSAKKHVEDFLENATDEDIKSLYEKANPTRQIQGELW